MVKKLTDHDLKLIKGGGFHFSWYGYGWGRASGIAAERRNPAAFLNHPDFIALGGK